MPLKKEIIGYDKTCLNPVSTLRDRTYYFNKIAIKSSQKI